MDKRREGRPNSVTESVVQKLEEAFALDCTVEEACFYADIARGTYYNFVRENPEFLDRFDELRQSPVLMARQELINGMKNNPKIALKYLERKKKDEFSPRIENINKNITIDDVMKQFDSPEDKLKDKSQEDEAINAVQNQIEV